MAFEAEEPLKTETPRLWRWACDACGGNTVNAQPGVIPEGWEVDDEDDLDTCRAVCPECVDEGESA